MSLLVLVSCGGSGGSSTPSTPTAPATPPSNAWSVAGRVVALDSGNGVAGATVTPNWSLAAVTADGSGNYQLSDSNVPPQTPLPVTVSADSMVTHAVFINWARGARTGVGINLIHNVAPFSLDYYRQLVRGTFDQPNAPFPDLRWVLAPSFYIRTVDDGGFTVPQPVIQTIIDAINRAVPAWTGGQYTPAAIVSGTEVRAMVPNWINIDIKRSTDPTNQACGQSFVGDNPGQITLWENVCQCAVIPGQVVMHEVGHALGFFHVNDRSSEMYPTDVEACPNNGFLSAADSFHSNIAYSRPRGNTDPDNDPSGAAAALKAWNPHIRVY